MLQAAVLLEVLLVWRVHRYGHWEARIEVWDLVGQRLKSVLLGVWYRRTVVFLGWEHTTAV